MLIISRSAFDLKTVWIPSSRRRPDCARLIGTIARDRDEIFNSGNYDFSDELAEYVSTTVVPERGTATGRALLDGKVVHAAMFRQTRNTLC